MKLFVTSHETIKCHRCSRLVNGFLKMWSFMHEIGLEKFQASSLALVFSPDEINCLYQQKTESLKLLYTNKKHSRSTLFGGQESFVKQLFGEIGSFSAGLGRLFESPSCVIN
jgi:hypothetical protein